MLTAFQVRSQADAFRGGGRLPGTSGLAGFL